MCFVIADKTTGDIRGCFYSPNGEEDLNLVPIEILDPDPNNLENMINILDSQKYFQTAVPQKKLVAALSHPSVTRFSNMPEEVAAMLTDSDQFDADRIREEIKVFPDQSFRSGCRVNVRQKRAKINNYGSITEV